MQLISFNKATKFLQILYLPKTTHKYYNYFIDCGNRKPMKIDEEQLKLAEDAYLEVR